MNKLAVVLWIIALFTSPLYARSIEGVSNEIHDPYFEDIENNWLIGTTHPLDIYNKVANPDPPGGYSIGNASGSPAMFDIVSIYTIVDDMEGGWNPDYSAKEVDLTFFARFNDIYQNVGVQFGWWDDPNIPRPPLVPGDDYDEQDGFWFVGSVSQNENTNLTIRNDLATSGEQSLLDAGFNLYCYHAVWDFQPRWVSIELTLNNEDPQMDGPYVTGIDFEARCVPEPGAILLSGLGLVLFLYRKLFNK